MIVLCILPSMYLPRGWWAGETFSWAAGVLGLVCKAALRYSKAAAPFSLPTQVSAFLTMLRTRRQSSNPMVSYLFACREVNNPFLSLLNRGYVSSVIVSPSLEAKSPSPGLYFFFLSDCSTRSKLFSRLYRESYGQQLQKHSKTLSWIFEEKPFFFLSKGENS